MDELAKRFAELAEKYGPAVADAAREAAQIEAYSQLARALLWLGAGIALLCVGRRLRRQPRKDDPFDDFGMIFGPLAIVLGALALLLGIWAWVDPWTWTAIVHPELWIAKQAFRL